MSLIVEATARALVSGTTASALSTLALAGCGARDCGSVFAPVNAVSHWLWRDRALRQQQPSWRYTLTGYVIHHAMSILWGAAYETLVYSERADGPRWRPYAAGLGVAATACLVDLKATPRRLTPGFERRLSGRSLAVVYAAFGIGLALTRFARRP
ncbi:hypothetical protein [Bordetella petrii]|uniref:hypothetical protein n=1 Tax=Bordetella petrii TaxID=94624 RepID=UPI00049081E8|nr:hypothetical protein [Bordetella petrii]